MKLFVPHGATAVALVCTLALTPVPTRAQHGGHGAPRSEPPTSPTPAAPQPYERPKPDRTVAIAVTTEGFSPDVVTVKRGERVRLVVKRTTDDTCAREFILDEFLVWKRLPLNESVSDEFVTGRTGTFTFKCRDGAVTGTLNVID